MKDLSGANAILTGASRGLGVVIAQALAAEGVNLALAARSADALERVRDDVQAAGVKAVSVPTDVGDAAQLEALVATAERELGSVDILVNNAGIQSTHPYEDYPPEEIERVISVNLLAPMLLTRRVLPGMLSRGRGHVLTVASIAGKLGMPCETPYATTKSGLIMFMHSLRAELVDAPVGCSVVCPGFIADEGMYADLTRDTGIAVPWIVGTSKPETVAQAVVRAIRQDAAEIIINAYPIRPLFSLWQLFPSTRARVLKGVGLTRLARQVAARRSSRGPGATRL